MVLTGVGRAFITLVFLPTLALVILGSVREIIGSGTLFQGASLMLGQGLGFLELTLIPDYRGFLLAILPPGGFVALGFLLAGKRLLDQSLARRRQAREERPPTGEPAA